MERPEKKKKRKKSPPAPKVVAKKQRPKVNDAFRYAFVFCLFYFPSIPLESDMANFFWSCRSRRW